MKEIVTFSDIILYWDIKERRSKDTQYYTYLDGELANESNKTHVTLRNILTKTAEVEIYTDSEKRELFYKKSFTMPQKQRFIDVTFGGEVIGYQDKKARKATAVTIVGFDDEHRISNVSFKNTVIYNGHSSENKISTCKE
ncbi:MAG: hypothetical protein J5766_03825 [Clostridia bacterium]|nr:hypothetical protein [Clostridia bacterium]